MEKFGRRMAALLWVGVTAAALTFVPSGVANADTDWGGIWRQRNSTYSECLDVRREEGWYSAHARIQQWRCSGEAQQQWSSHPYALTPPVGTEIQFQRTLYQIKNLRSGMCLAVRNGGTALLEPVEQVPCGSGSTDDIDNQLWLEDSIFSNGVYQLAPWSAQRRGANLCLDVPRDSGDDGVILEQYTCNNTGAQQFRGIALTAS